jgi:hypothetical protein
MVIEIRDADGKFVTIAASPVVAGNATIVITATAAGNRKKRIFQSVLTVSAADVAVLIGSLGGGRVAMTPKDLVIYWRVPSSSGNDTYVVTTLEHNGTRVPVACTCKDFQFRIHDCKHMARVAKSVEGLQKVEK